MDAFQNKLDESTHRHDNNNFNFKTLYLHNCTIFSLVLGKVSSLKSSLCNVTVSPQTQDRKFIFNFKPQTFHVCFCPVVKVKHKKITSTQHKFSVRRYFVHTLIYCSHSLFDKIILFKT